MTIAELHQQLTKLCQQGYGGAKVIYWSRHEVEPIDHAMLTKCFVNQEPVASSEIQDGNWMDKTLAAGLELTHSETFLMLE